MNDKDRTLLRYVVEGDIRKAQQQAKISKRRAVQDPLSFSALGKSAGAYRTSL